MLPAEFAEAWLREMITDPAVADWFLAKLMPHPLATWTQPLRLGNPTAAALPRAYIFCTEGKGDAAEDAFVRVAERVRSDPAWRYLELADTHMVNSNDPPSDGRGASVAGVDGGSARTAQRWRTYPSGVASTAPSLVAWAGSIWVSTELRSK